jgi:pyrroloquinoline quinone biosynthesis protein D
MQSACVFHVSTKDDTARVRVSFAPGVRLRGLEEGGAQGVLVCPEGNVQLNVAAAAILRLCDGSRDRAQVVAEILRGSRNQARSTDIVEFLDAAIARGWIQET